MHILEKNQNRTDFVALQDDNFQKADHYNVPFKIWGDT